MLTSLVIQNIILIDRLTLEADGGLLALTGETGAGKSILLDALGLALGARAESGLVRHGQEQASVTAAFDLPAAHPVFTLLDGKGISAPRAGEGLILRRTVNKDGRSKAFINDAPVSVQLLKEVGALLVEIHGQFETQGLLDPETHIGVLDGYAGLLQESAAIRAAFQKWRHTRAQMEQALADIDAMRLQEEYLKYTVAELEKFDPQPGEEEILAEKRHRLKNREKLAATYDQAAAIIEGDDGLQSLLGRLEILLGRLADKGLGGDLSPLLETLSRAGGEVNELGWQIEKIKSGGEDGNDRLDEIEDRYFGLKELAKKHRTTVDRLPEVYADLSQKLRLITHRDDTLQALEKTVAAAKKDFMTLAEKASAARQKAAQKLAKAVNAELPDLKLDKASFTVACARGDKEDDWNANGFDRVQFMVSTNPGTPAGAIHKIASGGELSRFMLALKVILAETSSIPTLIFDEVDSGIGGATADAVGERLQRLARQYQVLVVTHSPQVAARARHHWHVAKTGQKGADKKIVTTTSITPLTGLAARQEEIARMLSGAEVTREARAQAARLLENHVAAA
jgi:DNA repair protein RecN (Recombination protein N)